MQTKLAAPLRGATSALKPNKPLTSSSHLKLLPPDLPPKHPVSTTPNGSNYTAKPFRSPYGRRMFFRNFAPRFP